MEKSVKKRYRVVGIPREACVDWLLHKHYAKSVPGIMYSFGLYDEENNLQGVCCYGTPANNHNNELAGFEQIELVRLVVNEGLDKNVLSFFVSRTLKSLKSPLSIISYADQGKNHHGYIYQATNWIYSGLGGGVDFYIDSKGKEIHSRIMSDYRLKHPEKTREQIAEMLGWKSAKGTFKHRYLYFIWTPEQRIKWIDEIRQKYGLQKYPKGDNSRYDASYQPAVNGVLF